MKASMLLVLTVTGCGGEDEERVGWRCPLNNWCATENELSQEVDTSTCDRCDVARYQAGSYCDADYSGWPCHCEFADVGGPPCLIYTSWNCACFDANGDYVNIDWVCSASSAWAMNEGAETYLDCASLSVGVANVCSNWGSVNCASGSKAPWE